MPSGSKRRASGTASSPRSWTSRTGARGSTRSDMRRRRRAAARYQRGTVRDVKSGEHSAPGDGGDDGDARRPILRARARFESGFRHRGRPYCPHTPLQVPSMPKTPARNRRRSGGGVDYWRGARQHQSPRFCLRLVGAARAGRHAERLAAPSDEKRRSGPALALHGGCRANASFDFGRLAASALGSGPRRCADGAPQSPAVARACVWSLRTDVASMSSQSCRGACCSGL